MSHDSTSTRPRKRRHGSLDTDGPGQDVSTVITGGRIVTPEGVYEDGTVSFRGSTIDRVAPATERRPRAETVIDATDRLVMPGLVDLHGDDIERHLFPRPEARIGADLAITDADRANVTNGITTKFHAIAFENDPAENRTVSLARELVEKLTDLPGLLGDNRIHARCEVTESVPAVRELLDGEAAIDMVSLMNHVPGDGQFDDRDAFERRYADGSGATSEEIDQLVEQRAAMTETARWDQISTITEHASAAGVPVASHDDASPETVDRMAAMDVSTSEFPVTMTAAERATELGLHTVMGAPNLVQGGSLWDNLAVEDAIDEGLVDVLCSDYHPPSLLAAPFVDTGEPLHLRVARVTKNPADAAGLDDRGCIEPGHRADVIVVEPDPVPTVERAFVNGREVFRSRDEPCRRNPDEYSPAS